MVWGVGVMDCVASFHAQLDIGAPISESGGFALSASPHGLAAVHCPCPSRHSSLRAVISHPTRLVAIAFIRCSLHDVRGVSWPE